MQFSYYNDYHLKQIKNVYGDNFYYENFQPRTKYTHSESNTQTACTSSQQDNYQNEEDEEDPILFIESVETSSFMINDFSKNPKVDQKGEYHVVKVTAKFNNDKYQEFK